MAIEVKELSMKINLDEGATSKSKKDKDSDAFDCESDAEKARTLHIMEQVMEQVRELLARKEER